MVNSSLRFYLALSMLCLTCLTSVSNPVTLNRITESAIQDSLNTWIQFDQKKKIQSSLAKASTFGMCVVAAFGTAYFYLKNENCNKITEFSSLATTSQEQKIDAIHKQLKWVVNQLHILVPDLSAAGFLKWGSWQIFLSLLNPLEIIKVVANKLGINPFDILCYNPSIRWFLQERSNLGTWTPSQEDKHLYKFTPGSLCTELHTNASKLDQEKRDYHKDRIAYNYNAAVQELINFIAFISFKTEDWKEHHDQINAQEAEERAEYILYITNKAGQELEQALNSSYNTDYKTKIETILNNYLEELQQVIGSIMRLEHEHLIA